MWRHERELETNKIEFEWSQPNSENCVFSGDKQLQILLPHLHLLRCVARNYYFVFFFFLFFVFAHRHRTINENCYIFCFSLAKFFDVSVVFLLVKTIFMISAFKIKQFLIFKMAILMNGENSSSPKWASEGNARVCTRTRLDYFNDFAFEIDGKR